MFNIQLFHGSSLAQELQGTAYETYPKTIAWVRQGLGEAKVCGPSGRELSLDQFWAIAECEARRAQNGAD